MSKVYTIAFRMGVLFNVLLWTILNLVVFINTRNSFDALADSGISAYHAAWGFPCPMFNYPDFSMNIDYLLINAGLYVLFAYFFGFLFKFLRLKISLDEAR